MQGVIKKIVPGKPFGFISVEGEANDIFFHKDQIVGVTFDNLREGDAVTFEKKEEDRNGETKISAVKVQKIIAS